MIPISLSFIKQRLGSPGLQASCALLGYIRCRHWKQTLLDKSETQFLLASAVVCRITTTQPSAETSHFGQFPPHPRDFDHLVCVSVALFEADRLQQDNNTLRKPCTELPIAGQKSRRLVRTSLEQLIEVRDRADYSGLYCMKWVVIARPWW